MVGKIKTLTEKGFGFLSVEGQKKDLFFHANNLKEMHFQDLKEGDELEFDMEQGEKGAHAVNIMWAR